MKIYIRAWVIKFVVLIIDMVLFSGISRAGEPPPSIQAVRVETGPVIDGRLNDSCWQGRIKFTLEKTSEERHNVTLLFAWEDVKDYDIYILFSDIRDGDIEEQGIFAKYVKGF